MVNIYEPAPPPPGEECVSIGRRILRRERYWFLTRPSGGLFIAPLLYVPAAIGANRTFLALVAGLWLLGQVTGGILLLVGEGYDNDETPTARGPAVLAQLIGFAPWLALIFVWSALTTTALAALVPLLATWGTLALLISGGDGYSLSERIRASTYRGVALVVAGVFAFAGFIVGLILLIKALHRTS